MKTVVLALQITPPAFLYKLLLFVNFKIHISSTEILIEISPKERLAVQILTYF